jgi:hypothetical protein
MVTRHEKRDLGRQRVWCAGPVTPGKAVDNALWKVEETTLLDLEKEKWGSRRDSDIGFESAGTQTFIFTVSKKK